MTNREISYVLTFMVFLTFASFIFAFFKMNPKTLDVILPYGMRIGITGDPSPPIVLPNKSNDWIIIQSVQGKDKKGNEAIFDFYTLFGVNDDYVWEYGSWDWIEDISTNQKIRVDRFFNEKFRQEGIRERITNALDVISVGTASCEGSNTKQEEDRSFMRAKSIRKYVKQIAKTTKGETLLLLLGQHKDDECPQKSPNETRDQRSIIIIGVVFKNPDTNLRESVENAMSNLVSNKNLKQDLERYINNTNRSPLGSLDPKKYSQFDLKN
ncbi:hypothetical protein [Pseudanabaena yagii]|uniref:Uncharacterized protein n=1 Tax=Pseudanabaena yagii GIHE-NHR1 TaxID=2722753 RepID=A0ABX1LW34_9CYAN|nr:hypothetical protein [Pseudanabaena yagii]NMF59581.1 hypothetical protein [Pseudanabaena yagii GIHE-NHR1]